MQMVADEFADSVRNPSISWWGHAAAFGYDMAAQLAKVAQPVLVLNPDDDLHEHSLRAAPLMQRGRTRHLPGWGHGFLDVHTAAACAIVEEFLDEGLPPA